LLLASDHSKAVFNLFTGSDVCAEHMGTASVRLYNWEKADLSKMQESMVNVVV